jgi:hypothetical protein
MKVEFDHYSAANAVSVAGGVRLIREGANGEGAACDLWDGYFDPIMQALHALCFERRSIAYLPLLRDWNECIGYQETGRAVIGDLAKTVEALRKIDPSALKEYPDSPGKLAQVLRDLISFLDAAVISGATVTISDEY